MCDNTLKAGALIKVRVGFKGMTQEQTMVTLDMGREEMEWLNFISGRSLGEDPKPLSLRSVKTWSSEALPQGRVYYNHVLSPLLKPLQMCS